MRQATGEESKRRPRPETDAQDQPKKRRYSPSTCTGFYITDHGRSQARARFNSHVERSNLTLRMQQRRFTRLTNAFSRRRANLERAVALHFAFYNFVRRHQTLKTIPAFEAGVAKHVWTLAELAELPERYLEEEPLALAA